MFHHTCLVSCMLPGNKLLLSTSSPHVNQRKKEREKKERKKEKKKKKEVKRRENLHQHWHSPSSRGRQNAHRRDPDLTLTNVRERCAPFPEVLQYRADAWSGRSKPLFHLPIPKINLIYGPLIGDVSDIKLIRTDTTLDLSQKAEKRWRLGPCPGPPARTAQGDSKVGAKFQAQADSKKTGCCFQRGNVQFKQEKTKQSKNTHTHT